MSTEAFMAYWQGYQEGGAPLESTPPGVTIVALAFAVTTPSASGDSITLNFLESEHSEAEIRAGAKALQGRGVKVVMSINGNPNWPGHAGGWANLDAPAFAANVKSIVVDDWGLDGVDLDNEATDVTPGADFVAVVKALRTALGAGALLTLPVYMGSARDAYLGEVADQVDFVSTMAYWNDFDGQTAMFQDYASLVGARKVAIGVSDASGGQSTPFGIVEQLAAWNPTGGKKAGMMLWSLNGAPAATTQQWCTTIVGNLNASKTTAHVRRRTGRGGSASTEASIRASLGIPTGAQHVVFLDQAAHLDWDWLQTFEQYFQGADSQTPAVKDIFNLAVELVNTPPAPGQQPYRYSICEMGFFKRWVEYEQSLGKDPVTQVNSAGNRIRIVGGGITSPDNLLTAGEAFIRNYLQGKLWLASLFPALLPLNCAWLPDDFGHDPELPVSLQAMGIGTTSFSRVPGAPPVDPRPLVTQDLLQNGLDFHWQASDGSQVLAHWMQAGYGQGSSIERNGDPVAAIAGYLASNDVNGSPTPPYTGAKSPYLYVPVENDFMAPLAGLVADANAWNTAVSSGYAATGVYAVAASFADFAALVVASGAQLETRREFTAIPYWTGYYASRPETKIQHYQNTRLLLAAESLGLLAAGVLASNFAQRVSAEWLYFAPSTHHDYVTGTAVDDVYKTEQLPRLKTTNDNAEALVGEALAGLAGAVTTSPRSGETPVVIANPNGAPFSGFVELPGPYPSGTNSMRFGDVWFPVQATADGGLGFPSSIRSLGYVTGYASSHEILSPSPGAAGIVPTGSGASAYVLANDLLSVTVAFNDGAGWGITSATDLTSGESLLAAGAIGNQLVFVIDGGELYEFGNETGLTFDVDSTVTYASPGATVTESGPLRAVLEVTETVTVGGNPLPYTFTYTLVAGEPFLRMTTTGAAPPSPGFPPGYSVLVRFPLSAVVDTLVHGTPNHWTATQPLANWWPAPIFQATHHFVLPQSNGKTLAAIYHADVPAWGFDADGSLVGCILRNTPGNRWGASGTDSATHTLTYALRVPSGLGDPTTCQPLIEATLYAMPPRAALVTSSTGQMPQTAFIAEIVSGGGMITAAKQGDIDPAGLVLRLYQSTNAAQPLAVALGFPADTVVAITALEDPIAGGGPAVTLGDGGFVMNVSTALNTVHVT